MISPRIRLHVEPLVDQPETGVWCDKCLLPSAYRMDFATTIVGTRESDPENVAYAIITAIFCPDCGTARNEGVTR